MKNLLELTAEIVSAYVGKNPVPVAELPKVIADVSTAITSIGSERMRSLLLAVSAAGTINCPAIAVKPFQLQPGRTMPGNDAENTPVFSKDERET